jgi:IclR family transcriptional regulator, pca regulon regulatory protein
MSIELSAGPKLSGTVRKAFRILDYLTARHAELAPRDLAQLTGFDRTTVYRLLQTLAHIGVVVRDPLTRRYRLGLRTLDYANAVIDSLEVRHVALSHLIELQRELVLEHDQVERGLFIGVLDGLNVVLVEMSWTRSVFTGAGGRMRFPAHASAAGRCLLAYLPSADRAALLSRADLTPRTPRTLTSHEEVERRLERVRAVGFEVSDREVFADVVSIAAPVIGTSGAALAAIGLSAPASVTSVDQLTERFAVKLIIAAQRTAMALRYPD